MGDHDRLFTHVEDGGLYHLIDKAALLKHPDTGAWLAGAIYQDADVKSPRYGLIYATTEQRWDEKFRRWRP